MTKFIVLAGKKQVGKDTSARIISDLLRIADKRTHIVHFADVLKKACSLIFGISMRDMESEEGKMKLTTVPWPQFETHVSEHESKRSPEGDLPMRKVWYADMNNSRYMTVREVLQFVGTDLFRNQLDPDIWAKSVFNQQYGEDDVVIVADCRFPNEATLGAMNGLVIKVERNKEQKDTHISETALDSYNRYDEIVDNNGDIANLQARWIEILRNHRFIS